ncbi:MAG TPA: DeoR/GlpR family DNA-binding transcription regulator [Anaeromyxobacter sp.]|nr:DeoR/GlpR family DNA-binding transcription regulator [Anaeromyxobacter sp.]HVO17704.1 DeoR/GlpR family DNA-binding transcription regulator [Anaeromyxobacter sp.]
MRGPGRITSQRRQRLLDQLEARGSARVADLAGAFHVSEITIRRDLDELSAAGLVERYHGGVRLAQRTGRERLFVEKDLLHAAEKEAIGSEAASRVKDEDTVLLNAGSTTLAVIRHLRRRNVRIVTNNAAAPAEFGDSEAELIVLGGEFRPRSRSLFGELAVLGLSQIHASICILGTNGVSARTGLTTSVYAETAVNRLMVERADGNVVAVADGSKVGVTSNFACVPMAQVRTLITDRSAGAEQLDAIRAAGVQVVVCPVGEPAQDEGEREAVP